MAKDKPAGKKQQQYTGFTKFRKEWIEPILIALVLAAIIRSFIIQPFKIPSGSMEDTLLIGDQLMALKFSYGLRVPFANKFFVYYNDPEPGDVVVFKYPEDMSKDFIKRVIATEGQTVEIIDKEIFVDGELQEYPAGVKHIDPNILPEYLGPRDNFGPITVPEDHMFVMGDNRDNSNDSRFWGYVPYQNVKGKAAIIWWSWNPDAPLWDITDKIRWNRIFDLIR